MTMRRFTLLLCAAAATIAPARAGELVLTLDPGATTVAFTLDATGHTVKGTFALASGEVRFDPETGAAAGEIVVNLSAGRTGNERRDRKMHADVLNSATYPSAVFHPRRVSGALVEGRPVEVGVEGILSLRGADHPITLAARATRVGERVDVEVEFPVPFVEWGLPDPSFLVLRVAKIVVVRVKAEGTLR
jgi:polyisoprenoid-binding protein YceI